MLLLLITQFAVTISANNGCARVEAFPCHVVQLKTAPVCLTANHAHWILRAESLQCPLPSSLLFNLLTCDGHAPELDDDAIDLFECFAAGEGEPIQSVGVAFE